MRRDFEMVPLSAVARPISRPVQVVPGARYRTIGVRWWGGGAYERETIDGSETAAKSLSIVCAGDLIINKIWVRHGSTAIAGQEVDGCSASGEFPTFALDHKLVIPDWLNWITKTPRFWNQCAELSRGTSGKNRIKPEMFLTVKIPLPLLAEQRRLVERIEGLVTKVERSRLLRRQVLEQTETLLAIAFKTFRKNLLRGEYPVDRIGRITRVTSGGTPSRDVPTYWGGEIPWVKTGELLDGDIRHAEEHITAEGVRNSSAKPFPPDTILIALYGQGQTRGRTGRLIVEAACNQACCAILPAPSYIDPRFLQYWLRSLYLDMRREVRDGAQPNWNGQMIKNIEISLPPIEEQKRLVDKLDLIQDRIGKLKQAQLETEVELEALRRSVLEQAVTGML